MRIVRKRDMTKLTTRQQAILDYINSLPKSPSYRDLAKHFGINVSAAFAHVRRIKKKGFLREHGCEHLLTEFGCCVGCGERV